MSSLSSSGSSAAATSTNQRREPQEKPEMMVPTLIADRLVPKRETGADRFVAADDENVAAGGGAAGRGCMVGILDTGVDPAAHRFLADGVTPRLLDAIDCTASGDVDVSFEAELKNDDGGGGADADDDAAVWTVTGLTGRTLRVPKTWKIEALPASAEHSSGGTATEKDSESSSLAADEPTGPGSSRNNNSSSSKAPSAARTVAVRLGVKRAYELFPGPLAERVRAERARQFHRRTAGAVASLRAEAAAWNAKYAGSNSSSSNNSTSQQKPTAQQLQDYRDLQARLEILTDDTTWRGNNDPGPLYDCLVFWDGTHYRAAVDVHETGDLSRVPPLAAFGAERRYGTFGTADRLNFAVQFYRGGRLLSLVCDCSPHGTHVAGIAAAVAPDCQLVSFKIGEPRLRGMETAPALVRALKLAPRHHCDAINLSYGEAVQLPNAGNFVRHCDRLVHQDGVVFVAASGNQGPALSTVDACGATSSACLGVAAHVSPGMREPLYGSLPEPPEPAAAAATADNNNNDSRNDNAVAVRDTTYTWSSTGPAADGDFGVCVAAPGAAITTVPQWCLQKSRLMNGTSMASPNCTGCIALLISACKAQGLAPSPAALRRALENTAVPTGDHLPPLQEGWGMVNVVRAWEYLQANSRAERDTEDLFFTVQVTDRAGRPRGIYLRQPEESSVRQTFSVQVKPLFPREDVVSDRTQKRKIDLEMHFALKCSESWVRIPGSMTLSSAGNSLSIEVDPTGLKPGFHTARVCGYQVDKPDRQILFAVPITVIKPLLPVQKSVDLGLLEFDPAQVKRFFVVPPAGATWMDVMLRDARDAEKDGDSSSRLVALHTVQLLPHSAFREHECSKRLSLLPGQTSVSSIAVEAGHTCEIALAKFWSTRGLTKVEASVSFRGIRPEPSQINFIAGSGGAMVLIHSDSENEIVNPSAKLTKWQTPIRTKTNGTISPLVDERDQYPSTDKKTYQLVLTYEFEQEEQGSFTPRVPALNGVLYESGLGGQLIMAFDSDKKYLGMSDAYPADIEAPKGTVTLRLQVTHEDPSKLHNLKDLVVWIERALPKELSLSIYSTRENMMLGNDTFRRRTLRKGCACSVFIGEPDHSKLPTACSCGDRLLGSVTYGAGDEVLPGEGKRPGGFPISFQVGPKPAKDSPPEAEKPEPTVKPTMQEKLDDAIRDLKIEHLRKLTAKEKEEGKFDELYAAIEQDYPDHLPLRMAKLKYFDTHGKRSEMLADIVAAADAIISRISEDQLALNLGRKVDESDGDALKEREKITEKKNLLVDALALQALSYSAMDDDSGKLDETLKRLKSWVDVETEVKYAALNIEKEIRAKHFGLALKQVNKLLDKDAVNDYKKDLIKPTSRPDLFKKRTDILEKLGYSLLVEYDRSSQVIASPKNYTPF